MKKITRKVKVTRVTGLFVDDVLNECYEIEADMLGNYKERKALKALKAYETGTLHLVNVKNFEILDVRCEMPLEDFYNEASKANISEEVE